MMQAGAACCGPGRACSQTRLYTYILVEVSPPMLSRTKTDSVDWRLPPSKPSLNPSTPGDLAALEAYATYVKILSWFMDDPSPLCPFSVHRMALIGKELGKEVGEWFGPSTASGALK